MLISCIMPTRGRNTFASYALLCFQQQVWPERELVIVDDADCPSFPSGLHAPHVQYHLIERRLTIGEKRNLACMLAKGEVMCHWDDDEWYGPESIEDKFQLLNVSGISVAGYHTMRFCDLRGQLPAWWEYRSGSWYAIGSTLMYWRAWWAEHKFPSLQVGEDNHMVGTAQRSQCLMSKPAYDHQVSWVHGQHTSARHLRDSADAWRRAQPLNIPIPGVSACQLAG